MNVDGALVDRDVAAAGEIHERAARDHATGSPHQHEQEIDLEPGELDGLAVDPRLAAGRVDGDARRAQLVGDRGRVGAAQHRAQPGEQLARRERLGDVIVGTELEPDHAIGLVAARGQHDDGHAVAGVADLAENRKAVEAGHHHVEQHGVEAARGELREPGLATGGVDERDALRAEIAVEQLREAGIVVEEE